MRYTVRYTVTFGARSYPSRVRDTVTTSAVTSAGYELALGGSQTCNIWLRYYLYVHVREKVDR